MQVPHRQVERPVLVPHGTTSYNGAPPLTAHSFNDALAAIRKDQPSETSVHADAAGGTGGPSQGPYSRRRRRGYLFAQALAARHVADDPSRTQAQLKSFAIRVPIAKVDAPQRLVFGWASVIEKDGKPVEDLQGDVIDEPEMERAYYEYVEDARAAGEMHERSGDDVGKLVECVVFTKEKQRALGIDLGKVGTWLGFRLTPDVFKRVQSGELSMLSIGGTGSREEIG